MQTDGSPAAGVPEITPVELKERLDRDDDLVLLETPSRGAGTRG